MEAKKRAENALVERQAVLARNLPEPKVITPVSVSSEPSLNLKPLSESSTQTYTLGEPAQSDEEVHHMGCTKKDVAHAVELLEKIKADLSHLFPRQSNYIQRRTSTQVPRIPSKKSQVDKLPSISNTYPVNLTAAPVTKVEDDLQPKRSVDRHSSRISQSTLSAISQMWAAAVQEAEVEVVTERASMEVASQTMEQPSTVPENGSAPEFVPTEKSTASDKPNADVVPEQEVVSDTSVQSDLKNAPTEDEANKYPSTSTLGMLSTMWSTIQQSESLSSDSASASIETSDEEFSYSSTSTLKCHNEDKCELNTENAFGSEVEAPEDEAIQLDNSVVRPPTPPVHPKRSHLIKEAVASQTSLRQIREGTVSDFTNEFASPLAVYSHAMVPYQSARTRFGLHSLLDGSHTQELEEEASNSQPSSAMSEIAAENEQLRNSLLDLVPPMRTLEEYYAAESETSPIPPPCSPVSQQESTTTVCSGKLQEEVEQNVSEFKTGMHKCFVFKFSFVISSKLVHDFNGLYLFHYYQIRYLFPVWVS